MKQSVVVSEAAEADLAAAFAWYEKQRAGLGARLLSRIQATLDHFSEHPAHFPIVHRETRRALVRRFPYGVFYVVEPTIIDVIAVMHTHRDPRRWQSRAR